MSRVILFGGTGMVGQGVLRECLADPQISEVLAIGRTPMPLTQARLREFVLPNLLDYSAVEASLGGYDACFFCLGVSSAGMKEDDYHRITFDVTLTAAKTLVRLNPAMTFVYVSGVGTDSTEKGSTMWARVKGATENALRALPFKGVYLFRPGFIQPLHGIRSKTKLYQAIYSVLTPVTPLLKRLFPTTIVTTEEVGRAMLQIASAGYESPYLEPKDIVRAAERYRAGV